jgi:uncharacterized coiled-coil protein SlyX
MDTNNISSILDAITKANEAVKLVPELEAKLWDADRRSGEDLATIQMLNEQINNQQSVLTERAETIARLAEELSEARFREKAAREASEKALSAVRDIMEFANAALPVALEEVKEEPKEEPKVELMAIGTENVVVGASALGAEPAPEPVKEPRASEGRPYIEKPYWMSDADWGHYGGLPETEWEKQGYSSKLSWW